MSPTLFALYIEPLAQEFGKLSGYKIFKNSPSQLIRQTCNLKWEAKYIKYLEVILTKEYSELYRKNNNIINKNIQRDIERWSTLPMEFSSRMEVVKMNIVPRLLYLFQALPVMIPKNQFRAWDKTISRFVWEGKKPRIKYITLQQAKDKGGLALPNLLEYFHAAQIRSCVCWRNPSFTYKYNIEHTNQGLPIQCLLGDKEKNLGPKK